MRLFSRSLIIGINELFGDDKIHKRAPHMASSAKDRLNTRTGRTHRVASYKDRYLVDKVMLDSQQKK